MRASFVQKGREGERGAATIIASTRQVSRGRHFVGCSGSVMKVVEMDPAGGDGGDGYFMRHSANTLRPPIKGNQQFRNSMDNWNCVDNLVFLVLTRGNKGAHSLTNVAS